MRPANPARVDASLLLGAALVAGGILPFAIAEVAFTALALVVLLRGHGGGRKSAWRSGVLVVALAALLVGAARAEATVARHEREMNDAASVLPRTARCTGVVRVAVSPVRVKGALRWGGVLRDGECEGAAWSGPVTLFGGPESTARGDDVAIVAQLAPPTRLWNAGDPRPREARQGTVRSGGVLDARVVRSGRGPLAAIDRLRARLRRHIEATFPGDVAPMARALVLGESDLDAADDAAMRGSGLSHLLAVSGMHLVLAVVTAVAALRALLARAEVLAARWDVGRLAAAAGVPIAWAYAELAGDGGSTKRAAWMLTATFVARALGRRPSGTRAFGLSLVAMGLGDALVGFDVSFLLSAAATAGLMLLARPFAELGARLPSALQPIVRSFATTVAATIPCAPILAGFAPTLPLGGVIANLLAVPVGESLALPLCLTHALLVPWPAAARGCALAATGALRVVRLIACFFASSPALAIAVPPPTSWQLAFLATGAAGVLVARRGWRGPLLLATGAAFLVAEIGARHDGRPVGLLRATFLDVGQGDAALVDLPDGSALLIDGGGLVGSPIDTGERVIAPVLRARRRDALTLAVLSHPHPDHFGGLATGLGAVQVGALWDTGQGEREGVGGAYAALLAQFGERRAVVVRPPAFCGARDLGGARLEVFAPCPASLAERGPNDNSIVLRLSYGRRAFLFVGDAEREEEGDLLRDPSRLRADVLKVGHHGSRTSSSPEFLAAVAPREAVISVGARNRFGHPHPDTLAALGASGARVWRTDLDGAVTVTTDGQSLEIATARQAGRTGQPGERASR